MKAHIYKMVRETVLPKSQQCKHGCPLCTPSTCAQVVDGECICLACKGTCAINGNACTVCMQSNGGHCTPCKCCRRNHTPAGMDYQSDDDRDLLDDDPKHCQICTQNKDDRIAMCPYHKFDRIARRFQKQCLAKEENASAGDPGPSKRPSSAADADAGPSGKQAKVSERAPGTTKFPAQDITFAEGLGASFSWHMSEGLLDYDAWRAANPLARDAFAAKAASDAPQ